VSATAGSRLAITVRPDVPRDVYGCLTGLLAKFNGSGRNMLP